LKTWWHGLGKPFHSQAILIALQVAVSAAFLYSAGRWIDLSGIARMIKSARPGFLLVAVAIQFFLLWLNAFKIRMLVGKDAPSLPNVFKLNLMKLFFNNSLPGGMAGEVCRIYYLGKQIGSWEKSSAVVFFDRITSQAALGLSILIAFILRTRFASNWASAAALAVISAAFLGVLLHSMVLIVARMKFGYLKSFRFLDRFRYKIDGAGFREFFIGLAANPKMLFKVAGICAVSQALWVARLACLLWSLRVDAPLTAIPIALGLGSLLSLLPISIGGLGLNESAFALVFGMAGSTKLVGLSLATLQRLTSLIPALLGWIVFVRGNERLPSAPSLRRYMALEKTGLQARALDA
jgi:uncharacterized protein (TIRG00374 family)